MQVIDRIALILAIIGGLTAIVMKTSKWVYYTEEG